MNNLYLSFLIFLPSNLSTQVFRGQRYSRGGTWWYRWLLKSASVGITGLALMIARLFNMFRNMFQQLIHVWQLIHTSLVASSLVVSSWSMFSPQPCGYPQLHHQLFGGRGAPDIRRCRTCPSTLLPLGCGRPALAPLVFKSQKLLTNVDKCWQHNCSVTQQTLDDSLMMIDNMPYQPAHRTLP